jgi:hypothetical protein
MALRAGPADHGTMFRTDDTSVPRVAAVALALTGLIHLILAPEYLGEEAYVGVLFLLGAAACGVLAIRLWRAPDPPSWMLAALVAGGMALGFVLSRTTGLPGFKESEWELSGLVTLVLEGTVVAAAAIALAGPRRRQASPA